MDNTLFSDNFSYDDLCQKLEEGNAFSFSRFGDGELNAIKGIKGANCDNHRYFPDMGEKLKVILEGLNPYHIGIQTLGYNQNTRYIDQLVSKGLNPCNADILHNKSIEGDLSRLFNALKKRDVVFVGPKHLKQMMSVYNRFVEIPDRDCWTKYATIKNEIGEKAREGSVVVYCASMMSNCLINFFFYTRGDSITQIDAGSLFEPFVGVSNRKYHHNLKIEKLIGGANRWELINLAIEKMGYQSYLEIGVQNGVSFSNVKAKFKIGIDPNKNSKATFVGTSDQFFNIYRGEPFDIVFIDGLHHSDQVVKDFENSIAVLKKGGMIFFHDCLPTNEVMQAVPRKAREWTGDTWKAFAYIKSKYDHCSFVVNTDYGCGVVYPDGEKENLVDCGDYRKLTYKWYVNNRKRFRIETVSFFKRWINEQKRS